MFLGIVFFLVSLKEVFIVLPASMLCEASDVPLEIILLRARI